MKKRIPLIGSILARNPDTGTFFGRDQYFDNCYPQINQNSITGSAKAYVYKRPGFGATSSAAASYLGASGGTEWSISSGFVGVMPWFNGSTLAVYNTSDALIGATIANIDSSTRVTLGDTRISTDSYLTLVATKTADSLPHAWFLKEGDAAWTEITDVDYPANQTPALTTYGRIVHMDGYAFIMDAAGNIWNSDLNSLANWTATSFINAQLYPDGGAGLARLGNLIVAFGLRSVEFFQNAGNATGSPLVRVPSLAQRIGAPRTGTSGSETIKTIGSEVYFIGQGSIDGQRTVQRITQGGQITKISTPAVDMLISSSATAPGFAGAMTLHGMRHVVLCMGSNRTLAYCIDTRTWWYFTMASSLVPVSVVGGIGNLRSNLITTGNRNRYTHDPLSPVYQDNAVDYTMTIVTQDTDEGNRDRKFYQSVELVGDIRSTSGSTNISWSDDDGQNFSTARAVDMSATRARLMRCGSSRRRSWKITEAVNAPFRAEAIDVNITAGVL